MSKKSPQLRFEGFTYNWEERRLSEVLRERNNQQPQSMEYPLVSFTVENGVTPKTDRYEREQLVVGDKSSKKYKVTVLNDIVYNPANLKFGAISRNKYGNAVFSPIYVTFSVNNDVTMPEFIEMPITRKDFIKRALKYQQGTVYERQSVSPENLLSMNLYLPGKLEQEKIGTFFKHLDDTISLQQCKLDLLKEQKKGYLQKMFPKNGEKVPELRFEGFTDDWEQRELDSLATFSKGSGYSKGDLGEKGSPIILYGRLYTKYETLIKDVDTFVVPKGNSVISEGNEVIVPASGETSEDISRAAVVGKSGILLGGDLNIIKPKSNLNSVFLAFTISNGSQQKELSTRAQGNSVVHLYNSELKKVNLLFPSLEEQEKIGSFFIHLDHLIALHQLKLDLLKEQKKGFLQKMFV